MNPQKQNTNTDALSVRLAMLLCCLLVVLGNSEPWALLLLLMVGGAAIAVVRFAETRARGGRR